MKKINCQKGPNFFFLSWEKKIRTQKRHRRKKKLSTKKLTLGGIVSSHP
jgi:hypothetical protein